MSKKKTLEEVQEMIDNIYGKDIWTILEYEGNHKPCLLKHKCGELKNVAYAKNIKHGKLLCACDPIPEGLKKAHEKIKVKKEDLQKEINDIYGEDKWKIVDFKDMSSNLTLEHGCGKQKTISRAINIRKGTCTCECELKTKC